MGYDDSHCSIYEKLTEDDARMDEVIRMAIEMFRSGCEFQQARAIKLFSEEDVFMVSTRDLLFATAIANSFKNGRTVWAAYGKNHHFGVLQHLKKMLTPQDFSRISIHEFTCNM